MSAPPWSSSSSTLAVPCVVSHSAFVPFSSACQIFLFFLKYAFTRGATSFTDGLSCVLWQICCRASWNQLCLALVFSCHPLPEPLTYFIHNTFRKAKISFSKANYLFGRFLFLSIYVCFPKTLAKFDHSTINNECHRSIFLLVLIKEQQSTPGNRNMHS